MREPRTYAELRRHWLEQVLPGADPPLTWPDRVPHNSMPWETNCCRRRATSPRTGRPLGRWSRLVLWHPRSAARTISPP
jgi:hypothetical protein